MTLFDEQKAERRARILAAARTIIAERGYDGLTMRGLAEASRVSVPTLYNLFGGKLAILAGELDESFAAVTAALGAVRTGSFAERALAGCEAATADLLHAPMYARALCDVFLTSPETEPLRRGFEQRYVELIAAQLEDGRRAGDVAEWIDPEAVARREYAHYIQAMIQWARGDYDDRQFRAVALYGLCLILLGIASDGPRAQLERLAQELQDEMAARDAAAKRLEA